MLEDDSGVVFVLLSGQIFFYSAVFRGGFVFLASKAQHNSFTNITTYPFKKEKAKNENIYISDR